MNDTIQLRRRHAIQGAFWSEFIDMFDIYLPVVVLAPMLAFFQPPDFDADSAAKLGSLVFITTLLGRPIGALLFGMLADRIGRRKASIYSAMGFGTVTLMIAMLPSYETLGFASVGCLILLRFVDGIFIGGSYTGAMPLAIEYSLKSKRGLVGGFIMAGFCAAYVSINLIALLMFKLFPLTGLGSPYTKWGWRLPFVLGAALACGLALYYVKQVAESDLWLKKASQPRRQLPLTHLLRGNNARTLGQVLILMNGFWLTQNLITLYLPTILLSQVLHLSAPIRTGILLTMYVLLFFSYVAFGAMAQRLGRKPFLVAAGCLIATLGATVLYWLASHPTLSTSLVTVLVCALGVIVTAPWGVLVTYLNERFATDVRATAFGVGFSLSVVIPSFYAWYLHWLNSWFSVQVGPVILLILGGLLGALGAWLGPETKDVDL